MSFSRTPSGSAGFLIRVVVAVFAACSLPAVAQVQAPVASAPATAVAATAVAATAVAATAVPATAAPQQAVQPANQDVPKVLTAGSGPLKLPEGYAYPATLENIVKVAIRYKKIDVDNDETIDDIAKIMYCDVYNRNHLDEFTWRKVRVALRKKVLDESSRYPTLIYLNRREVFGQYNFNESMLLLKPSSVLQDVNLLQLLPPSARSACNRGLDTITQNFVTVLDKKLNIDGVKMSEGEAKSVVSGLAKTGAIEAPATSASKTNSLSDSPENDVTRLGYGRYVLDLTGPSEAPLGMKNVLVFSGHIESVTFFEDPYYEKPFWRGLASVRDYSESQSLASEIHFQGIMNEPGPTQQGTAPAPAPR